MNDRFVADSPPIFDDSTGKQGVRVDAVLIDHVPQLARQGQEWEVWELGLVVITLHPIL